MPHSLSEIYIHLVFSTKHRQPFLAQAEHRYQLHRYLAAACNAMGSPALQVGGVEDHIHIACRIARTMAVADLVRRLKRESSRWLKTKGSPLESFAWQTGYGAFSISADHLDAVRHYIANQEEHHRRETLHEEICRLDPRAAPAW